MTDTEISKYMALLLRHKPESAGLVLDEHGWADVTELLACIAENKEPISFDRLCEIVKNDNKQRYSFNEDKSKIRANQGHSIKVDVELKTAIPPEYLYHAQPKDLLSRSTSRDFCTNQGCMFICQRIPIPRERSA